VVDIDGLPEMPIVDLHLDNIVGFGKSASVITLKPAIRYHFKTGQRDWPET
jgi:hypothetical protein